MPIPDLFEGCYEGMHREKSPEEFKSTFCQFCVNVGCRNSKGAGTSWIKRMSTQKERLLTNPNFADANDPRFKEVSGLNFQDMLSQALAIEISTKKGDWEIPTSREIGREAAKLVGMSSPVSFEPPPPEKLVDEVRVTNLEGLTPLAEQKAHVPNPSDNQGTWKIMSSGTVYEVKLLEGAWSCSCPGFEHTGDCKHIKDVSRKLANAPEESRPPEERPVPVRPPSPFFQPIGLNTKTPEGGITIGGGPNPPKTTEPVDPWAPKAAEKILPVGGKIQFKKG